MDRLNGTTSMTPPNASANVEFAMAQGGRIHGTSSVGAQLLAHNFSVNALRPAAPDNSMQPDGTLRANATLQIREWIQLDTAVINVARRRLVGVQDLIAAGLTYPLPDAMGITQLQWQTIGTMTDADVSMSGIAQTQNDRQEYGSSILPIPIVHKEFQMNIRQLATTRRMGIPLDVTQAELCARIVSEKLETILFQGTTVLGSNNPIYGYTTDPKRATGSVTVTWVTATGAQIIADLISMINKLKTNNMYGPYVLYVPSAVYTNFLNDYVANSVTTRTILERILAMGQITQIKESKDLTASNVVLVQLTSDVIDLVDGMQPTTVQWDSPGGFIVNFKVMAIMIPRTKSDFVSQSGICHFS